MIHSRQAVLQIGCGARINLTDKRKAIIVAMARVGRTFSIRELRDSIEEDDRKIARTTIVRTLSVLVSNGLLIRYRDSKRRWVYEKLYNTNNGNRLVCLVCGHILEFGNEELKLETEAICKEFNFKLQTISSNIFGVCLFCRYFKPRKN